MAHSKFNLDGPAFEDSTQEVIPPDHIMSLREEEEVMEAVVDAQLFRTPPESPGPQEEQVEKTDDVPENSVLKCIMGDTCDHLHAFQEYEHYSFGDNSGSDCDVPEDELTDEMEDIFGDEDQLVPVSLQEEGGPTEGDYGQQSPVIIPVDDTIAIEENIEPSVVNLHVKLVNAQVIEHEDPSTPRHLDEMEDIVAIEEDQLVQMNSQEAEHFSEGDHDQSTPRIIPVADMCSEEEELIPANLQEEEDPTVQGDHDQTSHPGNIPLKDITPIEGNETSPVNLHITLVSVLVTEPDDPCTPRHLDFNIATFDSADQEVIPEIQVDVTVQTVATTSAAEGGSSSSSRILMGTHVEPKSTESEDWYELLHETVNGDSIDLKDVNETALKRAIEVRAPET